MSSSKLSWLVSVLLAVTIRLSYHHNNSVNGYNATTWDALGYYMYLPATFIYQDVTQLNWLKPVEEKYQITGGYFYQAIPIDEKGKPVEIPVTNVPAENQHYVFKYLGGVAIMQSPFFFIGHLAAKFGGYPQDGFSAPYQYAIMWGAVFWFAFGLYFLRKSLLKYFADSTVAITLLAITFATNLLQYISVDGGMSHAYIFPLYALVLWFTIRWHEKPGHAYAFGIGLVIGLSVITRPTELIMIFIPLLWRPTSQTSFRLKWDMVLANKTQITTMVLGGILAILPQIIYWKYATGLWLFDVGSKWYFLNPWWRVLVGFEKGWFIYTPITIFMVIGLFFMRQNSYRIAVLVFCILNIWVIISWHEWGYGASYSTRALTQSYPVFAFALGAFIERQKQSLLKYLYLPVFMLLAAVNLFQIWQYNKGILHYSDMNAAYYSAIYLDPRPTPLDYSLLDTEDHVDESSFAQAAETRVEVKDVYLLAQSHKICTLLPDNAVALSGSLTIRCTEGAGRGNISLASYNEGQETKLVYFRLGLPDIENECTEQYEHHYLIPSGTDSISLFIHAFDYMSISSMTYTYQLAEKL